jgi:transcriptional regulator of acetoin/glycerol metabolism
VKREITAALRETGGNITHAARALGIGRISLWKRMRSLGIDGS